MSATVVAASGGVSRLHRLVGQRWEIIDSDRFNGPMSADRALDAWLERTSGPGVYMATVEDSLGVVLDWAEHTVEPIDDDALLRELIAQVKELTERARVMSEQVGRFHTRIDRIEARLDGREAGQ